MYQPAVMPRDSGLTPPAAPALPGPGPAQLQLPKHMLPINVQDVMPSNAPNPTAMRSGGIASLRYADGGTTPAAGGQAKSGTDALYTQLGGQLPNTWGTSAQDTYNRNMALGQSQQWRDYYNSLPSHLRAYVPPPATGPNDPNWSYLAEQQRNQWEVSQGTNPWDRTPAGEGGGGSGVGQPKGLTKPLKLPPGSKEGIDNDGGTIENKPGADGTTGTTPKPTNLGVRNYRTYTPPERRVYTPNTYSYKPTEASILGRGLPPKVAPAAYNVPAGPRAGAPSFGRPFVYDKGIAGLKK